MDGERVDLPIAQGATYGFRLHDRFEETEHLSLRLPAIEYALPGDYLPYLAAVAAAAARRRP